MLIEMQTVYWELKNNENNRNISYQQNNEILHFAITYY